MNCPRHPGKREIASCKECRSGFCIECVRETDQTTLCPDCLRRRRRDMEREYGGGAGAREWPSAEGRRMASSPGPVSAAAAEEEAGKGEGTGGLAGPAARVPGPGSPETATTAAGGIAAGRAVPKPGRRAGGEHPSPTPPASTAGPGIMARVTGLKGSRRRGADTEGARASEGGAVSGADEFLAQGPDEDFSLLQGRGAAAGPGRRRGRKVAREGKPQTGYDISDGGDTGPVAAATALPGGKSAPTASAAGGLEGKRSAAAPKPSRRKRERKLPVRGGEGELYPEDALLHDVVSTLLMPEGADAGMPPASAAALEEAPPARRPAVKAARTAGRRRERAAREKRAGRWSFLAQPRSSDYTLIALSWWRAALFIAGVLLGGAALWAAVNAYLIPRDTEYGAVAIVIGVLVGLAFWWKAGRKHGTKLAVQASLVTFFALFLGEFLHWFLIIVKHKAFRTIFFDLVSFRFIWENGAEIMRNVVEAMFPTGFLLLLILPTLAAFIIAFGMPPIPEVFAQFWRALRGEGTEEEGARHGLEG